LVEREAVLALLAVPREDGDGEQRRADQFGEGQRAVWGVHRRRWLPAGRAQEQLARAE